MCWRGTLGAFVVAFAAHRWTRVVFDGRCIHEFIMPSSRTETESESADFFMKPAETDHLQDFEKLFNNTGQDVVRWMMKEGLLAD